MWLWHINKPEDLKDRLLSSTKYYCLNFTFRRANQVSIIMALRKIVKEEKPDVIHAHLYWSIIMARLARPKSKIHFHASWNDGVKAFQEKTEPLSHTQKNHYVPVTAHGGRLKNGIR